MKVIAINGSPTAKGNIYQGLRTVCDVLEQEGIETEIIHIGNMDIQECNSCGQCKDGYCVLTNDQFRDIVNKIYAANGLLLGSPVDDTGISETMKNFLDRLIYPSYGRLRGKVGAFLLVSGCSDCVIAYSQFHHYLMIGKLFFTYSYNNIIHGEFPDEILEEAEDKHILHNIGQEIERLLSLKEKYKL